MAMTISRHEQLLPSDDAEAVIASLIEKAVAGCMLSAGIILKRRPVTSGAINPLSIEAVVTAVLAKAEAGDKAALRLKAKHLDDRPWHR